MPPLIHWQSSLLLHACIDRICYFLQFAIVIQPSFSTLIISPFGESFRFLQLRRKIEINLNFERWPRQDSRVATEACAIFDGGQIVGENRQFVLENQQKIKDLSKDIKDSKEEPGVALG